MITAPDSMTAEQLVGYTVPGKRVELVRGQLVVREPASFRHGDVGLRLGIALGIHLAHEQQANAWATKRGLAVEVRSLGDRAGDVIAKVSDWLETGTLLVWSVDPERKQVVVYRADGSVSVLGVRDTLLGDTVLPDFAMALAVLFADD